MTTVRLLAQKDAGVSRDMVNRNVIISNPYSGFSVFFPNVIVNG